MQNSVHLHYEFKGWDGKLLYKRLGSKYVGLAGHIVCIAATQLYCYSTMAVLDTM